MLVEAHVAGFPVEETVLSLAPVAGFVLASGGAVVAGWRRRTKNVWHGPGNAVDAEQSPPDQRGQT